MSNPPQPPGTEIGPGRTGGVWRELRSSPGAAWAGPLLIFAGFMALNSAVKSEDASEWYRAHPEQWVYPLQTLTTLAAIAFWWSRYSFRPLKPAHIAWAVVVGTAGIVLWILPSWLCDHNLVPHTDFLRALGFTSRSSGGFDPTLWADNPAVYWGVVTLRMLRMTVAVAFAEELFWRGFLWRTVSEPYRDFSDAPFGQRSWKALAAVVGMFAVAHLGPDIMVAVIWCLLVSALYVRTRSVGACVIAHAVSNLILGIYVMVTRQWGFW